MTIRNATQAAPIRVIIADDQALVREGLSVFLQASDDIQLVGEAATGEALLTLYADTRPGVVLLDMKMPGWSGIQTLQTLKRMDATARVIMLTNLDDHISVRAAIDAGALGYLLKDVSGARLAEAIRRVYNDEPVLSPTITNLLMQHLPTAHKGVDNFGITKRELEILNLIADGQTNAEIAYALGIKASTVKTYVRRITSKLNVNSRLEAVTFAIKHGIIVI